MHTNGEASLQCTEVAKQANRVDDNWDDACDVIMRHILVSSVTRLRIGDEVRGRQI